MEKKKKKSVLEKTCISLPRDGHKRGGKKRRGPAANSSHSMEVLLPWRQHKGILFCFVSFPLLSKGADRGQNLACLQIRSKSLHHNLKDLFMTLEEDSNV